MNRMIPYSGDQDIRQQIEQIRRELSSRSIAAHRTRDFHIDCANGDQIDVHEDLQIWIQENY